MASRAASVPSLLIGVTSLFLCFLSAQPSGNELSSGGPYFGQPIGYGALRHVEHGGYFFVAEPDGPIAEDQLLFIRQSLQEINRHTQCLYAPNVFLLTNDAAGRIKSVLF